MPAALIAESKVSVSDHPIIDGRIEDTEWLDGDRRVLSMVDGTQFETTLAFNDTHLFVLFLITDDDPTIFGYDAFWDAIGVEFDNNGDQVPMGLYSSPDDALFVSYSEEEGVDYLLQGMGNPAIKDTEVGGSNDVEGNIGIDNNLIIIEACRKLDSGDTNGSDVSLKVGNKFWIMFAYWDNMDIHSQSTTHSNWISFTVTPTSGSYEDPSFHIVQFITELVITGSFVSLAVVIRFRTNIRALFRNES